MLGCAPGPEWYAQVRLSVPTQGAQAFVTVISLIPTFSPWLDAVVQHQSNACNGKLVLYGPAQNAPSSASAKNVEYLLVVHSTVAASSCSSRHQPFLDQFLAHAGS